MLSIDAGQILDGLGQPAPLELDILGDQPGDDDARLVQHDMAERHAFGDGHAAKPHGELAARLGADVVAQTSPPEAIISASTMAVVCSASTSSSLY